jgi:hypothetical protein
MHGIWLIFFNEAVAWSKQNNGDATLMKVQVPKNDNNKSKWDLLWN